MSKEQNLEDKDKALHIAIVSKRCDSCDKDFDQDDMHMLDNDWWLCEDCFIEGSEGCCQHSSYCNYTGNCEYVC